MRYPPMKTASTSCQLGCPATNIGAIVVTSSSEMIRGLVSETRSRTNERARVSTMAARSCVPRDAGSGKRPLAGQADAATRGDRLCTGTRSMSAARYARTKQLSQIPTPVASCSERSTGGMCSENHRRCDRELEQHHAQRDVRRAHDDRRFVVATLAQHHHHAEEMQHEQEGQACDGSSAPRRPTRRRSGSRPQNGTVVQADGRARMLRGKSAECDGEDRERPPRRGPRADSRGVPRCTEALVPPKRAGANRGRRHQCEKRHRDEPVGDGRPRRVAHLDRDAAEDGRGENRRDALRSPTAARRPVPPTPGSRR